MLKSSKRKYIYFSSQLKVVLLVCGIMLIVEIINGFSARSIVQLGLVPHSPAPYLGILLSPFIHGNSLHFMSNIIPLACFTFLMLQHGLLRYLLTSLIIILMSGVLIWLFGRTAIHIGASGLIYGYFGYLLLAGILSRELTLIGISLFVAVSYGGMIFGILPRSPYISWEAHLFGFFSGLLCALWYGQSKIQKS